MTDKPKMLALEPRLLFDGAMMVDAVDTVPAISERDKQSHRELDNPSSPRSQTTNTKELVIIDSAIKDYSTITSSVGENAEIYILPQGSTLADIANFLEGYKDIDALHIFTHGQNGKLVIGNEAYDQDNIGLQEKALSTIGSSLSSDGDILLYGCNIASDPSGTSFVDEISRLTSADVAASDDITGNPSNGGDWELEYESGTIEQNGISIQSNCVWIIHSFVWCLYCEA